MSDPQQSEQASNPTDKGSVRLRLVMALLVGFVTAIVGCLVGLFTEQSHPHSHVRYPQTLTLIKIFPLLNWLREHKELHGSYPLTLEEMTDHVGEPYGKDQLERRMRDSWGNSMVYSSDGKTWELLSYGADGKPGGIGLDADIRCTDGTDWQGGWGSRLLAKPTLPQVFRYGNVLPDTICNSVILGFMCFLFALHRLFRLKASTSTPREIIIKNIKLMIITSLFVAFYSFILAIDSPFSR